MSDKITLYNSSLNTARHCNEVDIWRQSDLENSRCATAIHNAIDCNFVDNHLNTDFMKKFLIWMVVTCIGCGNLWAADRTVKGYVLDKEGTPLPGAYVYDEDKHTAVTNEDGYFELSVSEEIKQL